MAVEFNDTSILEIIAQMEKIGYDFNWQNEGAICHMVFIKGYNPEHPEVARAYEELKRSLATRYKHERVEYRIAKSDFIKEITDKGLLDS